MTSEWTSPSVIASAISAAAATAAAVIAWMVYRQQRRGEDTTPQIHCEVKAVGEQPEWYRLWICLENFSAIEWDIELLDIRRPRGTLVAPQDKLRIDAGVFTGLAKDPFNFDPRLMAREVRFEITLRTPTTPGRFARDRLNLHFFVYSPRSIAESVLSMRLSLRSRENIQRRKVIAIKRTLPANTSDVTDEINSTGSPPK